MHACAYMPLHPSFTQLRQKLAQSRLFRDSVPSNYAINFLLNLQALTIAQILNKCFCENDFIGFSLHLFQIYKKGRPLITKDSTCGLNYQKSCSKQGFISNCSGCLPSNRHDSGQFVFRRDCYNGRMRWVSCINNQKVIT